jgi:hypothetical protein
MTIDYDRLLQRLAIWAAVFSFSAHSCASPKTRFCFRIKLINFWMKYRAARLARSDVAPFGSSLRVVADDLTGIAIVFGRFSHMDVGTLPPWMKTLYCHGCSALSLQQVPNRVAIIDPKTEFRPYDRLCFI